MRITFKVMFHVKHFISMYLYRETRCLLLWRRGTAERWIRSIPISPSNDATEKSVSRQCLIAKRFFLFPHIPFTTGIGPIRFLRNHLPHWGRLFYVSRETIKSPFLRKGQARLRAGDRPMKKSCWTSRLLWTPTSLCVSYHLYR